MENGILTITDINGTTYRVKLRLPWGKERQLLRIIGEVASQLPSTLDFSTGSPGLELLKYITNEAPDRLTNMLSIVLNMPADQIENEFDGDAVIEFAIPFIAHYLQKWSKRLESLPVSPFGATAPQLVQNPPVVGQVDNEGNE
ncbi:MAG: hypothetical protein QXT73_00805 [Candidatus Methanomethylicaceae archaeon]